MVYLSHNQVSYVPFVCVIFHGITLLLLLLLLLLLSILTYFFVIFRVQFFAMATLSLNFKWNIVWWHSDCEKGEPSLCFETDEEKFFPVQLEVNVDE